jgi:hypothetical protein
MGSTAFLVLPSPLKGASSSGPAQDTVVATLKATTIESQNFVLHMLSKTKKLTFPSYWNLVTGL